MKVWLFVWHSPESSDVSPFETREGAEEALTAILNEMWQREFKDIWRPSNPTEAQEKIRDLLEERGEHWEINEDTVIP